MAKQVAGPGSKKVNLNNSIGKGTTIGRGLTSRSTMNKHKKRSYKKYRGQGK